MKFDVEFTPGARQDLLKFIATLKPMEALKQPSGYARPSLRLVTAYHETPNVAKTHLNLKNLAKCYAVKLSLKIIESFIRSLVKWLLSTAL
jgi:hypothetical protein